MKYKETYFLTAHSPGSIETVHLYLKQNWLLEFICFHFVTKNAYLSGCIVIDFVNLSKFY